MLREAAGLGFAAMYVPEELGGAGLNRLDAALVFEALAMACPAVSSFLSIHNMCAGMIARTAATALRARYLPGAVTMETILAYCLTEPGSGSDAAALRTRAVRSDDGWRLDGTKAFISGGGFADLYVVMARTGGDGPKGISAIVVEDGTPGLCFGAPSARWAGRRSRPRRCSSTPAGCRRRTCSARRARASATPWPGSTAAGSTSPRRRSAARRRRSTSRSPTPPSAARSASR